MSAAAPLHLLEIAVEPEWIDYNDHMNVGYYVVAFDRATDELIDRLGMDEAYRARSGCTVFVLENDFARSSSRSGTLKKPRAAGRTCAGRRPARWRPR